MARKRDVGLHTKGNNQMNFLALRMIVIVARFTQKMKGMTLFSSWARNPISRLLWGLFQVKINWVYMVVSWHFLTDNLRVITAAQDGDAKLWTPRPICEFE